MFVKGNKMGGISETCCDEFKREVALIGSPSSDNLKKKKVFSPLALAVSAGKMECPLCTSPQTGSIFGHHSAISVKQTEPCPSKKP